MKLIRHFISGIVFLFAAIMLLFSCHLEDFDMKKLADPVDIVPEVFAPLAYGTFKVSDLVPNPAPTGDYQIPPGGIDLSAVVSKLGNSFSSAAIDTIYLVTLFTNNTPCEMEFELSFVDASGNKIGRSFTSDKISAGAVDKQISFTLDPLDQKDLEKATNVKLSFKLYPPATGINTYGEVKSKSFTVKISFHAPVELQKL